MYAFDDVSSVSRESFDLAAAKSAAEAFCVSSSLGVMPIARWDGTPIGAGKPGRVALALRRMLLVDKETVGEKHTEIPYGYLTNMRGL